MACASDDLLEKLISKLREHQSYCPMCGGEMVCSGDCPLQELWFPCPHYVTFVVCDGTLHTTVCEKCEEDLSYEDCPQPGTKHEPEEE